MTQDPGLDAAKTLLRIEARKARKAYQAAHPEADWHMADHLDQVLAVTRLPPGNAALYKALGSEIDPRPLADELIKRGWTLSLPAVVDLEAPLEFRAWKPRDPLIHDLAGLAAPLDTADVVQPSLIFTPVIAFDRAGRRLGQGGGYYDRTFAALRALPDRPWFIGLAFCGQEVDAVPHGPFDETLDGILTDAGYSYVRKDI